MPESDFPSGLTDHNFFRSVIAPPPLDIAVPTDPNFASEFYDRLIEWIREFDEALDEEHEIGIRLVSFGQTVVFYLTDMGYWNPSLISFMGKTEDGQDVELIQHVSQISILLMRLPKQDPSKPKRKLGFITEKEDDKE